MSTSTPPAGTDRAPDAAPAADHAGIGYLPGLDGLRAVSVLAVIAYHLDLSWATGGYLGVEVFFVVSGYLITLLALDERQRTGALDRMAFWGRRARRLLPAVVVLVVAVLAWSVVVLGVAELRRWRGDGVASLLYVQNWHSIVTEQPYFVSFGRPPPLRHLWSLAIEEQFYLLWPLVLPYSLRRFGRRTTMQLTLVGAVCSLLLMRSLADIAAPERAYYGTDTRAFGILIGCTLAFAWRPDRFRSDIGPGARRTLSAGGGLALGVLVRQLATRSEFDPWTYPWGFALVDVCTVVLIVTCTHPGSGLRARIGSPALAAVGRRSYSLYLWHWPVIVFTRPGRDWPLDGAWGLLGRVVLIVALSELSYRWIEQPFRDGRARARLDEALTSARAEPRHAALVCATAVLAVGLVAAALVVPAPAPARAVAASGTPVTIRIGPTTTAAPTTTVAAPPSTAPTTTAPVAPAVQPPVTQAPVAPPPAPPPAVTVIGESVTMGAVGALQDLYGPRVQIDAVEGRSYNDGVRTIEALAQAGRLTPVVVVHLGNNGAVPEGAMARIAAAVTPQRRLVLVTVRVPRRWEGQVNQAVIHHAQSDPTVAVADWYAVTGAEPGLLVEDGVHLTEAGARRYSALLQSLTG